MHRRGHINIKCTNRASEGLPDFLKNYYNSGVIVTSKTVKHPYSCPKGRKKCSLCNGSRGKKMSRTSKKKMLLDNY